jgi:hypothetical protein
VILTAAVVTTSFGPDEWERPIQSSNPKWELGAEPCAKRKATSPCLLAIPACDRVAGLHNIYLILIGEYANAVCEKGRNSATLFSTCSVLLSALYTNNSDFLFLLWQSSPFLFPSNVII